MKAREININRLQRHTAVCIAWKLWSTRLELFLVISDSFSSVRFFTVEKVFYIMWLQMRLLNQDDNDEADADDEDREVENASKRPRMDEV